MTRTTIASSWPAVLSGRIGRIGASDGTLLRIRCIGRRARFVRRGCGALNLRRPTQVVLDATGLSPCWDRIDAALLSAVASGMLGDATAVTAVAGRMRQVAPAHRPDGAGGIGRDKGAGRLATVRAWLLDDPPAIDAPAIPSPRPDWRRWAGLPAPGRAFQPSGDAIVLKPDLGGWDDPVWQGWLGSHRGLRPVCFAQGLWGIDYPEYLPAPSAGAFGRSLPALARVVRGIVTPSEPHRDRLEALLAPRGIRPPILVQAPPSRFADTEPPSFDAALAAVPYVVAFGPLDARSNLLLLLTTWRALARDRRAPKLVLAGARGFQFEELRPMLDWNESNRPHVREAPGLDAQALRHLLVHANGVLAPSFAPETGAAARDAQRLGVPVVASDTPVHAAALAPDTILLPAIDGRGWRNAILALAERPVAPRPPAVPADEASYWVAVRPWLANLD